MIPWLEAVAEKAKLVSTTRRFLFENKTKKDKRAAKIGDANGQAELFLHQCRSIGLKADYVYIREEGTCIEITEKG